MGAPSPLPPASPLGCRPTRPRIGYPCQGHEARRPACKNRAMTPVSELGSLGGFLHASRARLTPEDVGLGDDRPRRVPGLRREEIAMLAGVSASSHTRLEQGQALNASMQVIDALSRAMRLSDAEREHLHVLASASHRRSTPVEPAHETVEAGLAE